MGRLNLAHELGFNFFKKNSPIFRAAYEADMASLQKILKKDPDKANALTILSKRSVLYFASNAKADNTDVIEALLTSGANIEYAVPQNYAYSQTVKGATAIKFAIDASCFENVALLLERGAKVDGAALELALLSGHYDIFKVVAVAFETQHGKAELKTQFLSHIAHLPITRIGTMTSQQSNPYQVKAINYLLDVIDKPTHPQVQNGLIHCFRTRDAEPLRALTTCFVSRGVDINATMHTPCHKNSHGVSAEDLASEDGLALLNEFRSESAGMRLG